jgi:hypothetical protein
MCFIVVPLTTVRKLCGAAHNVLALVNDGTLAAAFSEPSHHDKTLAVAGFDALLQSAALVVEQISDASPFLRYRREILADCNSGAGLRALLLNLYQGRQGINLSAFFMGADEHHTRIALDMLASYTKLGENDQHFMALGYEIGTKSNSEGSES